jgi:hypothetical protein
MSFFITTAIAALGLLGFSELLSIKDIWKESAAIKEKQLKIAGLTSDIKKDAKIVQDLAEQTKTLSGELDTSRKMIDANRSLIADARARIADHIFLPMFRESLAEKDDNRQAIIFYEDLRQLKSGDSNIRFNRLEILADVKNQISSQHKPNFMDYTELLWKILEDDLSPEERITAYFMVLANALLVDVQSFDNGKTYEATFVEFKKNIADSKGQKIRRGVVDSFEKLFDEEIQAKRETFQRIRKLVSTY